MTVLDMLQRCPDAATLKPALHRLCEKFGPVARLDVLTASHEGTRQAICFLRLESPEREQVLMQTLGVGRFGGEIVFVVDLNAAGGSDVQGASSGWAGLDGFDAMRMAPDMGQGGRDFSQPRQSPGRLDA